MRVVLAAVASGSILLCSATAAATDECALSIRAEGLDETWASELEVVRDALGRRDDVDSCASIVLERAAPGARMTVVLQDGRSTKRLVSNPRDLLAVVTALVLLPAPRELSPALEKQGLVDAREAVEPSASPFVSPFAASGDQSPRASMSPATRRRVGFGLGGVGGTRWSGTALAGDIGVLADVRLDDWVLGMHGRWDAYAATSAVVDYTTQALEVGADLGRTFRLGTTSLTVLAGPRFVFLSQNLQSNPPSINVAGENPKTGAPIGSVVPSARDGQVLRIGGAIRYNFLSLKPMNVFVAVDAEVDAMPDAGNRMPAALAATNPLPIWSAGLSLGGEFEVWP